MVCWHLSGSISDKGIFLTACGIHHINMQNDTPPKFTVNISNFKVSITITRTLALSSNTDENKDKVLSSNTDENKDKVLEKHQILFCPSIINFLPVPLPPNEEHKDTSKTRAYITV